MFALKRYARFKDVRSFLRMVFVLKMCVRFKRGAFALKMCVRFKRGVFASSEVRLF